MSTDSYKTGDTANLKCILKKVELPGTPGLRLDIFLAGASVGLTRNQAQNLIEDGLVYVSGVLRKANYKLKQGDIVSLSIPEPEQIKTVPENLPVDIIYEDDDIVVVNKAAGMVVHPAEGNPGGTLVNALLFHCGKLSTIGGDLRPGVVHRLDKDTSGIMVAAKNEQAHQALAATFKAHTNSREYVAIVIGRLKEDQGTVTVSIGRHITDRKKISPITFKGKNATTHYRVLEHFGDATYIALRLATGRTHQIRVHMAHIGHPLAGDKVYGGAGAGKVAGMKVPRQMLHARLLGFKHPRTGEYMEFTAEIPPDMERVLDILRRKKKA